MCSSCWIIKAACRHARAGTHMQPKVSLPQSEILITPLLGTWLEEETAVNTCFAETEINLTRTPFVETACRLQITWKTKPKHISICLLLLSKLPHHFGVCACLLNNSLVTISYEPEFSNLYLRIKFLSRKWCKFQRWLLPTSLRLFRSQDTHHWGRREIPHILFQLWPATFCLPQILQTPPPCLITKTHKMIKA